MDLNEIKQIIEIDGGKFIIVENGKPAMVILDFQEYKKNLLKNERKLTGNSEPVFGTSAVKPGEIPRKKILKESEEDLTEEDLTIEDLPV